MSSTFTVISTAASSVPVSIDATYSCVHRNLWTEARHPINFPGNGNAHWSPTVIASHGPGYEMWAPGILATSGVERVAESGSPSVLSTEFSAADDTNDFKRGSLFDAEEDSFDNLPDIEVTDDFPLLSTISMIAPSPDWFSGFYNFDARDSMTDTWWGEFVIESGPWDAGTETGETYSFANDAEDPHVPISQFTVDTVPSTGVFLSSDESTVLPTSRFECTLLTTAPSPAGDEIQINWFIPTNGGPLPPVIATVGDTLIFNWAGSHNVQIHPTGDCSMTDRIFVGNTSGARYTLTEDDIGELVFACDIGSHCEIGQIMTVTVQPITEEPSASPTESPTDLPTESPTIPAPTCAAVGDSCVLASDCCSGRCQSTLQGRACRRAPTAKTAKLSLAGQRGGAGGAVKDSGVRRLRGNKSQKARVRGRRN